MPVRVVHAKKAEGVDEPRAEGGNAVVCDAIRQRLHRQSVQWKRD